jgi:hypothetical protein
MRLNELCLFLNTHLYNSYGLGLMTLCGYGQIT